MPTNARESICEAAVGGLFRKKGVLMDGYDKMISVQTKSGKMREKMQNFLILLVYLK